MGIKKKFVDKFNRNQVLMRYFCSETLIDIKLIVKQKISY